MKLKLSLLSDILNNANTPNKYSKAFLAIKNVIDLELKESESELTKQILDNFTEIEKSYYNFINNIPLKIIERYYINYANELSKYPYIEYEGNELAEYKVIDIYNWLEDFFEKIFALSCEIADLYNIEVKLKEASRKIDTI